MRCPDPQIMKEAHSGELYGRDSTTSEATDIGADLLETVDGSEQCDKHLVDDDVMEEEEEEECEEKPAKRSAKTGERGPKKKIGRRKRKSAEEKAANVRARNRRAQQAFRKRQKALSQERSESMANLMEELDALRETNKVLQNTVNDLVHKLEQQEIAHMDQMDNDACLLINPSTPQLEQLNPNQEGGNGLLPTLDFGHVF